MVSTTLNDDELPPNNSDDDCIFSTTDLEEGIEIPIEIIGTSLVDVVVTSVDDEDDQYHLTALKKEKEPSLSPTKTVGTIESDDFELDDAISNEKTKKLSSFCCCTSSNNKRPLFITLAIIATLTAIIALSLSTSYLLLNSNNNKAVEEEQIQPSIVDDDVIIDNDGNDDGGGDKPLPKEDTSTTDGNTTAMTTTTSTTTTTTRPRDLFLLSGQSNMVGHTSSKQSIGGNGDYWNRIKSILEQGDDENLDTMEEKLYQVIYETNYYNDQVATTLTNGVMDLYKSSLLNDLDTPLTFGRCSFQEASDSQEVEDVSHGTVPISLNSNCGHSFGHESLFGRTLELDMNYTTIDFELHKVARGGSSLFEHWYPNHGQHWNLLKEAIEERRGQGVDWKGFIWHQGSQEAWSEEAYGEDRSRTFYGNLTGLVNEVRELMFQNSMTWRCKEEIPVVIVQVGSWPGNNAAAQRTRDAQAKFCNDDPRAVLVKTDDLSTFYHYDAASFLISGNRIAYAYQEALGGVVECPDRVPSSSPSDVAVSSLSSSSSVSSMPTVIRLEADLPPSSVISELV